jgi:hypothetical protein
MTLPNQWEQLTKQQFIDVAAILSSGTTDDAGRIKLLWILSGLTAKQFTAIPIEEIESRFPQIEWIKDMMIEKSFLPYLKKYFLKYKGPEDRMQNITLDQFIFADHFLLAYLSEKKETDLDSLISILYCNGFNPNHLDKNINRFNHLQKPIKQAVFVNYSGMRQYFIECFPGCFSKEEGQEGIRTALNPWDKMKDDLCGPKFGKIDEIGNQNIYSIFTHLQNNIEKAAKSSVKE